MLTVRLDTGQLRSDQVSYAGLTRALHTASIMICAPAFQGREPTNADLNRFAVLGWAVEYLQAVPRIVVLVELQTFIFDVCGLGLHAHG